MNYSKAQTFSEVVAKISGNSKVNGNSITSARKQSKLGSVAAMPIEERNPLHEGDSDDEGKYSISFPATNSTLTPL